MQTARTAYRLAIATAVICFLMIVMNHLHGITQQAFEMMMNPGHYTSELMKHARALNMALVADNIFIILYVAMAYFLIWALRKGTIPPVVYAGFCLITAVGVLDFIENFHIYTLMHQYTDPAWVQNPMITGVPAPEIQWQASESMLKWHLSYLAFFLLGWMVSQTTLTGRIFRAAIWYWFIPTGIFLYAVAGTDYEPFFQQIRFGNLLGGFVLIALLMRQQAIKDEAQA